MDQISNASMKMLKEEAREVYAQKMLEQIEHSNNVIPCIDAAVEHALNHALEEGIVILASTHSLTYECPECGSEVDIREADAL
jgi:predicted RNA-binding Zn-ribbon protein involved in translation (DUF1610 family)